MERGAAGLAQPAAEREFGSIIVATTQEKFEAFKKKLSHSRREALAYLDTPPEEAEMVVSFSFQYFAVAKAPQEKEPQ